MLSVFIFSAGSPIIVDVEESCARCSIDIIAIIKNTDDVVFALDTAKVRAIDEVPATVFQNAVLVPLFTPGHRKHAKEQVSALGANRFETLIDPTAILPRSLTVGSGVYVNSGVTIGAASRIDDFVFINRAASLGHHFYAEEFVSIGPGVVTGGDVKIGRGAVLGTGAVILPGIRIGANSVIGAGSVVTRDVPSNTLVIGNPARVAKQNITGYNGVGV